MSCHHSKLIKRLLVIWPVRSEAQPLPNYLDILSNSRDMLRESVVLSGGLCPLSQDFLPPASVRHKNCRASCPAIAVVNLTNNSTICETLTSLEEKFREIGLYRVVTNSCCYLHSSCKLVGVVCVASSFFDNYLGQQEILTRRI